MFFGLFSSLSNPPTKAPPIDPLDPIDPVPPIDYALTPPPRFLKLNCALDGDYDPNHIFTLGIAADANVDCLKERIRMFVNPFYQNMPSFYWQLWKVDLPVDKTYRETRRSYKLQEDEMLVPVEKLLSVFPEDPEPGALHIIAKPLSMNALVASGQCLEHRTFQLNIAVANHDEPHIDPHSIINFAYARDSNVSALKYSVKEMVKPLFDKVPYYQLGIWFADLPIDENLGEALKGFALDEGPAMFMNNMKTLEEVFADGIDPKKLHFIVKAPPPS